MRRNHTTGPARAVGHRRRDRQLAAPAHAHPGHALIPAGDHLALAELELQLLSAIPRRVELLAGRERDAHVVDGDLRPGHGLRSLADADVVDPELERDVTRRFLDRRPVHPLPQDPHVESLLAVTRHPVRRCPRPARDDLRDLRTRVPDGNTIIGGDSLGEAAVDELAVPRAASLLPVVVRTGAPGEEAEAVHALELRAERVGHPLLEPADHPGTRTPEHDALLPRLTHQLVDPVHAPD